MDFGPLLVLYLVVFAVLHLALRIFAGARGHAGLSAATALVLFAAGGLLAGGLFAIYVARPTPPLQPVSAFAGTLVLAGLLQWILGVLLVRRRIPRSGRAVAAAVLLTSALACVVCAPALRMAERKFAFFRQVDELQRIAPSVCVQWERNEAWHVPDADLEWLPDYLARQGWPGPVRPQDVKSRYPVLWTTRSAMPRYGIVVLADGRVEILSDDERDALLAQTVAELSAARNPP